MRVCLRESAARATLLPLCKDADIVFTDRSDASIIFGTDNPEKIADSLHNSGSQQLLSNSERRDSSPAPKEKLSLSRSFLRMLRIS
ncbi:MAG: hypothetical protein WCC94_02705 [Candidatus Bathyarchaeia archaeon]